ncbi:MAG: UDP-N-acetylmuramoyl-tripeptide--D-alanyl-D-alanine ligase [Candidatus Brocadiia bacterium]
MSEEAYRARFTARQIAEACGGRLLSGPAQAKARGISTDTRTIREGEAFFALMGPNHDAHAYLPQAVEGGASVLVVQRLEERWRPPETVAVVEVQDSSRALLALAARHRERLRGTVLAVTGSCGKSTVKAMLGAILSAEGSVTAAPASFNNRIGVAHTLLSASPTDRFMVLEMGTNHPGEIDELAAAARPQVGVITTIAPVHLEGLGGLDGVREAKAELIAHLPDDGALVLNADDPQCAGLEARFEGRVVTFGESPRSDVRVEEIRQGEQRHSFRALGEQFCIRSGARHDVLNAAAALAAATCAGVAPAAAMLPLARCRPLGLRYERRRLCGVTFVLDCYNSNPAAMRSTLRSFLAQSTGGRRIVVSGDMRELGSAAPEMHRQLGRELAQADVDLVVGVGPLSRHLLAGWHQRALPPKAALCFPSAEEAWRPLWSQLRFGDLVLLKGSRAMRLETIPERIAQALEAGKEAAA